MKKALAVPMPKVLEISANESVPLEEIVAEYNDDEFIHAKLKELYDRCSEISKSNNGMDANYAIDVIRKICSEIGLMKLKLVADRPRPGWYSYDGQLLRNVASIVFKMELLAAKYFADSYKRYTYISSHNSCNSKDKIYELADEWMSDRRTMVDVVSSMLNEVQGLGITANPVPLEKEKAEDSILHISDDLLPAKRRV